jgi:glycosyltransferase involved in cell wall biosynthesis
VVPGGGVRLDDHADPGAARAFREVYDRAAPFFLVLGRKTASKGYEQVLRAHQMLRRERNDIDLVLIGPDENGREVRGEGVTYLGRQPRDVIRGALAHCIGLVTMSRSESFGIVLCEAWLFGKPVIANRNCYAFRALVRDGETGLLVSSDAELKTAMATLADNAALRHRMGRAGFADVITKYSWEQVANAVRGEL